MLVEYVSRVLVQCIGRVLVGWLVPFIERVLRERGAVILGRFSTVLGVTKRQEGVFVLPRRYEGVLCVRKDL